MKIPPLLILLACAFSTIASAQLVIVPTASFRDPDMIADNIKVECGLPEKQIEQLEVFLKAAKTDYVVAGSNEVPATGEFLDLEIVSALSMGNAFMGHKKQVSIKATLYKDGQEVVSKVFMRNSMGGMGAGFKGSCSVLGRCCKALGKDVTNWLKTTRS